MTVKQKQCLLYYLGYYKGNIDGDWGPLSREACQSFQRNFFKDESKADGICGTETEKALTHAVAYGMSATDTNVGDKTGTFWDDIEFFDREEFRCKCGGKYCDGYPSEIDLTMVRYADEIRRRIGRPLSVNSGLRCSQHNANVGGVSNSQHVYGTAADLGKPSGVTVAEMAAIAEDVIGNTGGIGIYSWGIHIDSRKTKSRWNG